MNRRNFLQLLGVGVVGVSAVSLLNASPAPVKLSNNSSSGTPTAVKIKNNSMHGGHTNRKSTSYILSTKHLGQYAEV